MCANRFTLSGTYDDNSLFILDPEGPGNPWEIGAERRAQSLDASMGHIGLDTEDQKRKRLFLLDNRRQFLIDHTQ